MLFAVISVELIPRALESSIPWIDDAHDDYGYDEAYNEAVLCKPPL